MSYKAKFQSDLDNPISNKLYASLGVHQYKLENVKNTRKSVFLLYIYICREESKLKINIALSLQNIWRIIEKRKDYTPIMAHITIL